VKTDGGKIFGVKVIARSPERLSAGIRRWMWVIGTIIILIILLRMVW